MSNIIKELAEHDIHSYGSEELLKFEKNMEKYFSREYERWEGNKALPEEYGISSFEGNIANEDTFTESIDHYNKSFKIYKAFLDDEYMSYTMGYYETGIGDDNNISLIQSQINKYELVIKRAQIKDGQHILDMGCGFGGFAKYLLHKFPNVQVTGINPSKVQASNIIGLLDKNSNERFFLIQKYFDELNHSDLADNSFDRVISLGVFEHVTNFDKLFQLISRILKDDGKTFHHFIVSIDTIPRFLSAEKSLMADYFPGGHIWPYNEPKRHVKHLHLENSWFVNGINYWKTLDSWHQRFWNNILDLYPKYLSSSEIHEWNMYFCLCKTMFLPKDGMFYGNGHYLYQKIKPV